MPVQALRLIRKMRGGAQAHLLEASDNHAYVVKFHNNPQHRRILVNEWIASTFLHYLGIAAPQAAMVEVTNSFLVRNSDVSIQLGKHRQDVPPGWHYGSRFPGDPARTVVYDYLPDALLEKVENLADFRAVLVFDKWIGNADSRQAIFFRARVQDSLTGTGERPHLGFVAEMMDNGYVFEGPHWRFVESAIQGLYFRPLVYREVRGLDDFEPWLDRIRHFPEEVVDQAVKRIPPAWLEGDEEELERLLEQLLRRRARVPELIENCRNGRVDPFPNWRGPRLI
jgi:hypothetical protein